MQTSEKNMRYLIVIPSYNEAARLPPFLKRLLAELSEIPNAKCLVQVVDDGSSEFDKRQIANELVSLSEKFPESLAIPLLLEKNVGKGGAVLAGWREHTGMDFYAFVDADGAVASAEIVRLLKLARKSSGNTIFGSRVRMLGKTVIRGQLRHLFGRIFATLVALITGVPVYDSQCGVKIMPKLHWLSIQDRLSGYRYAFDVELLMALQRVQAPVIEIPIDWQDIPGSKVRPLRDGFTMLRAVFDIAKRHKGALPRQWSGKSE